jgi:phosphate starvation-inducible PhoH-like protein
MAKNDRILRLSNCCYICKEESCICDFKRSSSSSSRTAIDKRSNRKPRKQNHKELLNLYYADVKDTEFENSATLGQESVRGLEGYSKGPQGAASVGERSYFAHLSAKERAALQKKILKPKNKHQEEYCRILQNPEKKIVVVTGPAGTGKTMYAASIGCYNFLTGKCDKLIFTRPSVSVDEDLGYLPGTLEEKMAPWIRPIYDVIYQFISPREVAQYIEDKTIEIAPLGFMRGRTFKNAWIVADEMQNSTVAQMKMLMTRIGENSRIIITGDLEQYDRQGEINGMEDFLGKFKGKRSDSIDSFEFERGDIQREEVVKEVLEIYA